jgi:hypothetical protein
MKTENNRTVRDDNVCLSQATLVAIHGLDEMYCYILLNHDKLSATELLRRINTIKAGMLKSVEQIARDNGV